MKISVSRDKKQRMIYELKQYGCNGCGKLSSFLDTDESMPVGWICLSRFVHYCPECAKPLKVLKEE